jgi:hypothetical protein
MVRKYRAEHRAATKSPHKMVVTVAASGQFSETATVVDSGFVEGGVVEDGL